MPRGDAEPRGWCSTAPTPFRTSAPWPRASGTGSASSGKPLPWPKLPTSPPTTTPSSRRGSPAASIRDPDQKVIITRYYHTPHDTVDKLRVADIRQAAFLCARLAWRVANAGDWPRVRPDAAGVARAQAEYDASQVSRQLEAEIEALRKRRQADPGGG